MGGFVSGQSSGFANDHGTNLISNYRDGKSKSKILHPKARILHRIGKSIDEMWKNFLSSNCSSFAVAPSELKDIIRHTVLRSTFNSENVVASDERFYNKKIRETSAISRDQISTFQDVLEQRIIETEIDDFLNLIKDISMLSADRSGPLCTVDFVSVLSSALLLCNDDILEKKLENLFFWIALDSDSDASFTFDQWLVALASFERGVSIAMGQKPCSETVIETLAVKWMTLMDVHSFQKSHISTSAVATKTNAKSLATSSVITKQAFFNVFSDRETDLWVLMDALTCVNLNQVSLIEIGADDDFQTRESQQESKILADEVFDSPSSGDQWLANPSWKKTAESMIPAAAVNINKAPSETLELEWCHGYRGFDCRNNVYFGPCPPTGYFILFHSAALIVAQGRISPDHVESQSFFKLHNNDIMAMAVHVDDVNQEAIVASGESGKTPVIHLSVWKIYNNQPGAKGHHYFTSLAEIRGFHKGGISQLTFSTNGSLLFSVSVDYTVAVYFSNAQGHSTDMTIGKLIWSSQGPKERIHHACGFGDNFVSCGEKHVTFWKSPGVQNSAYSQISCKLGQYKSKTFLSCVATSTGIVSATTDGDLMVFSFTTDPNTLTLAPPSEGQLACHKNGIYCLWPVKSADLVDSVVVGGKDGFVSIWHCQNTGKSASTILRTDEPVSLSVAPLKAVTFRNGRIAFATAKCEIYILSSSIESDIKQDASSQVYSCLRKRDQKLIVTSHFKDEVWALATHPQLPRFVSGGDDGTLRFWDSMSHHLINMIDMGCPIRCCAYSSEGIFLAAGLGLNPERMQKNACKDESGLVRVYRSNDISSVSSNEISPSALVAEIKDVKAIVTVVKFSPDSSILAVGAKDGGIFLYSSIQQFKRKTKFTKHSARILSLDFSVDGKYIQSCCAAYEILFSEVSTGKQAFGSSLRQVEWKSWTCSLGWPVIGIWSGSMDGSDVNAVDRSPSNKLLVVGDDFSRVNLYRYPALQKGGSDHQSYRGHSSHVSNVKWLYDSGSDNMLVSAGGADKSILLWKLITHEGISSESRLVNPPIDLTPEVDEIVIATSGDEFMAVKPWLGSIFAPTHWKNVNEPSKVNPFLETLNDVILMSKQLHDCVNVDVRDLYNAAKSLSEDCLNKFLESSYDPGVEPPSNDNLVLDFIHGFRGDRRNNVFSVCFETEKAVLYPAAAIIVVAFEESSGTGGQVYQKYLRGHTDDVTCLDFKKVNGDALAASGQLSKGPTIVWDISGLKPLAKLQTNQKSVNLVAFSSDGRVLASIGEDGTISASDWRTGSVLANAKLDGAIPHHILALTPVVMEGTGSKADAKFAVCGDKFMKVWALSGRTMSSSKVLTSSISAGPQQYFCQISVKDVILIGAEDGFIYVSTDFGKSVTVRFDHHSRATANATTTKSQASSLAITSLTSELDIVVSGARNGTITVWSANVTENSSKFNMATLLQLSIMDIAGLSEIYAKQIHSVSISQIRTDSIRMIIGTRGCDLFEVDVDYSRKSAALTMRGVIVRGHCNDEVWGLAVHPFKPEFITTGDDKILRFFTVRPEHRQVSSLPLGYMSRCCCYSKDGSLIAVGFGGRVGRGSEEGRGYIRIYSSNWSNMSVTALQKSTLSLENSSSKEILAERKDAKQLISDIKFSSDGNTLVAASHDCKIYVYDIKSNFATEDIAIQVKMTLRATFSKHNSAIKHFDISSDGRYMQSSCSGYELLFSNCQTGKHIPAASELKDVKWETWTNCLGWPVQGIWPSNADGSDINAVDRSHSGHLISTADDFGNVNLFQSPCLRTGAIPLVFNGHSSHVTNVRWTTADEFLISCGGADRCVFVWKHTMSSSSSGDSSSSVARDLLK